MGKVKIYRKLPTIAYCGSLIQQNHGETLDGHGYLLWDVNNKTYESVDILNDYGYITLSVDDGKILNEQEYNIPKRPHIRLKYKNTSASQLKDVMIYLRQTYNPAEVVTNRCDDVINRVGFKLDLSRIRDPEFQNELFREHLQTNFTLDDKLLNKIYDINRELNSKLPVTDIIRNVIWKPKNFKFSNMFSYGDGNVVDFSKLSGMIGLFSSNASGKTSLLEALTFCLFDKCSKSFKASNILNNRKKQFSCEFNFEINGVDYFIKRIAKKQSSGSVTVKVDFYKLSDSGERVSLNGEQRRDTDNIIRSYIGTYEDFILTAVSTQHNNANVIDKSQTERKDLIGQFMDINVFDQLYDLGSNAIKEYSVLLKQFEKRDFDEELKDINSQLNISQIDYNNLESEKIVLSNKKEQLELQLISLAKRLIPVDDIILDIDELINQEDVTVNNIELIKNQLSELNIKFVNYENYYSEIIQFVSELTKMNIEEQHNELIILEKQYDKMLSEIDVYGVDIKNKLDKAEKLLKLEYDENCEYCMNNIFVKDAIIAKEELANDKEKYEYMVNERNLLKSKIDSMSRIKDIFDKLSKTKKLQSNMEKEILTVKGQISEYNNKLSIQNSELSKIKLDIVKYNSNKKSIESNHIVELEMTSTQTEINSLNNNIKILESDMRNKHSNILILQNKINMINDDINKFKQVELDYTSYNYYLECVNRDSVPYQLILKTLPTIEYEINNILSQMVDFNVMLDIDNKNINIKIVYDEHKYWPVEMSSGMEKFIVGISMRMALLNISNLPRPDFMAIDEGFSTLDADNMSNLPLIFDYLRSYVGFILIISHLDHIRDFVDTSLDLRKENDFSKIVFK